MNKKRYIKKTYEKHSGDLFAIRQQLIDDYRERVPEAVVIVDEYVDSIFAMPYTDGAQYINLEYAKEHVAK
jgi:hypothetical protein